jgi:3-oxoacyl-[acyl-carrier-protein] synthase-3
VPEAVHKLLVRSGKRPEDIDMFVFHQANAFMLEHLREKLKIPPERFLIAMQDCGNTVSSTIPIALKKAADDGHLCPGHCVMIVGFGVGYSWSAALINWAPAPRLFAV